MAVAIAKVTYTDKHTDEAGLTPRVITSCEEHAQKEGWAPGEAQRDAPLLLPGLPRLPLRRQDHAPIPAVARPDRNHRGHPARGFGKPYGLAEWPEDSLGLLSFILARRFGGTPWQWRNEASELDWGTGIRLLNEETERMEEGE